MVCKTRGRDVASGAARASVCVASFAAVAGHAVRGAADFRFFLLLLLLLFDFICKSLHALCQEPKQKR
jgi:hypothetical protein